MPIDPLRPVIWRRKQDFKETKESYEFIDRMEKHTAEAAGVTITIGGEGGDKEWVELNTYEGKKMGPEIAKAVLETLRKLQGNGQVKMSSVALHFATGQGLLDWIAEEKMSLGPGEVSQ